jgi:hypothetical protein
MDPCGTAQQAESLGAGSLSRNNDANIDYYYDFSQSIEEYTKTFAELDLPWHWQPVTVDDYDCCH